MPLKNTNKLPPGGWVYDQKGPDGKVIKKFKSMAPFTEACMEVQRFRQNNKFPRAELNEVMDDVEEAQCARLGYDSAHCVSKKKKGHFASPSQMFQASASHLRESVEAAGRRISQAVDGLAILKAWLGHGAKPVSEFVAQERADICTGRLNVDQEHPDGKACPFNEPGYKPLEAIAKVIREQVEEKKRLSLHVEGEDRLHSCKLCWCHLPLKVHVPMDEIRERTPSAMLEKFRQAYPPCWMNKENPNPA